MLKRAVIFLVIMVFAVSAGSLGFAEEKTIKGTLVIHPETKDVKVVTEDFQYHTIYFDKKTKVEATVKAKTSDLEKELKNRTPNGSVTYEIKDGKPVATKISFKSGEDWGIQKKKKGDED